MFTVKVWNKNGTFDTHDVFSRDTPPRINNTDTVGMALKKISYYIPLFQQNPSDIYAWVEEPASNDPSIIFNFINHAFQKSLIIPFNLFQRLVKHRFAIDIKIPASHQKWEKDASKLASYNIDKITATNILTSQKDISKVLTPIGFHYVHDGFVEYHSINPLLATTEGLERLDGSQTISTHALLLKTFDIMGNTIHVIHRDEVDPAIASYYFPLSNHKLTKDDIKLLTNLEDIEKDIDGVHVRGVVQSTCFVNFLHIQGNNMGIQKSYSLDYLFDKFQTTNDVPFMKLKTPTNIFYKVHKQSLVSIPTDDITTKWTKTSASKDTSTSIAFKIKLDLANGEALYASFTLHSDMSYVIKLTVALKHKQTAQDITGYLPKFNKVIKDIEHIFGKDAYIPLIHLDILTVSRDSDVVNIVQLITSNTLDVKDTALHYKNFAPLISTKMYPYFGIIETKDPNILYLQFKCVNNYAKFSNIESFITLNRRLPHNDLVQTLVSTFLISVDEAEKEISAWQSVNQGDDTKRFVFHRWRANDGDFVTIKIRLNNPVDMRYLINGAQDMETVDMINNLLLKLVVLSGKTKKVSSKSKDQALYDDTLTGMESLDKRSDVDNKDPIQNDDSGQLEFELEEQTAEDDIDDAFFADDFAELEKEFTASTSAQVPPQDMRDNSQEAAIKSPKAPKSPHKSSNSADEDENGDINLKGYFLNKLKEADPNLFAYQRPHDRKDYATLCQKSVMRQPVVVSHQELDKIQKDFPNAIQGYVKSGSTPELEQTNRYICPKVWCPKSRVALSFQDYVKYGRKCPYPEVKEKPIVFESKYYGTGDVGIQKDRYPGFLDSFAHPDQYCLPCCFKLAAKEGNRNKSRKDKCENKFSEPSKESGIPEQQENVVGATDDATKDAPFDKYILGENTSPLDMNRFGLLPADLVKFLEQENLQGNHRDGTGTMKATTVALLRKGIRQSKNSFLEAVAEVLDNTSIASGTDIIKIVLNHLDVATFLSLENGRIMKMFVDTSRHMYQRERFEEFYHWFKKQSKYISQMNLHNLLREMDDVIAKKDFIVNIDEHVQHHQEMLREYIIYNAFQNFRAFLENENIPKEHIVLQDLIVNKLQHVINVNRYNFVVLNYDIEKQQLFVHCSVNQEKSLDTNYPLVLLIKRNAYYEPIYYVKNREGSGIDMTPLLDMRSTTPAIKQFLTFIVKNCKHVEVSMLRSIKTYLASIGHKVKYTVLDYGYKSCGFVIDKNLYIPLPVRFDMYYEGGIKYMYINDVAKLRCTLDLQKVKGVFQALETFTGQSFYGFKSWVTNKGRTIGCMLRGHESGSGDELDMPVFIPLHLKKTEINMQLAFVNGLHIFVGYQDQDERGKHLEPYQRGWQRISLLTNRLRQYIQQNVDLQRQVSFILDKHNPLPMVFKQHKMRELISSYLSDIELTEGDIYMMLMYLKEGHNYDVYKVRSRRFAFTDNELFFDHFDIRAGKLMDAAEHAKNPYLALMSMMETNFEPDVSFVDESFDSFEDVIGSMDDRVDVPVKWRRLMPGFKVVKNKEKERSSQDAYGPDVVLQWFKRLAKQVKHLSALSDIAYHTVRRNEIINSVRKGETDKLMENPWTGAYFKRTMKPPTMDNILEAMTSMHYYPSILDIQIISKLAYINVVLIGRMTRENPDGFEVMYYGSPYFVIMEYAYDRFKVIDRFHLVVDIRNTRVLFRQEEMPVAFLEKIAEKMHVSLDTS